MNDDINQNKCPRCNSYEIVGTGARDKMSRNNMECFDCGLEWEKDYDINNDTGSNKSSSLSMDELLKLVDEAKGIVEGILLIEEDMKFVYKQMEEWGKKFTSKLEKTKENRDNNTNSNTWSIDDDIAMIREELKGGRLYLGKMLIDIKAIKKADDEYTKMVEKVNTIFGRIIMHPRKVIDWDSMIKQYIAMLDHGMDDFGGLGDAGEAWKKG